MPATMSLCCHGAPILRPGLLQAAERFEPRGGKALALRRCWRLQPQGWCCAGLSFVAPVGKPLPCHGHAMAFFGENLGGQLWIDQIWWLVIIIFEDFRRDTPIYCYDVLSTNDEYCKTNGCERTLHWVTLMNIRILLAEKSHRHLIEHTVIEQHRTRKNWLQQPKALPNLLAVARFSMVSSNENWQWTRPNGWYNMVPLQSSILVWVPSLFWYPRAKGFRSWNVVVPRSSLMSLGFPSLPCPSWLCWTRRANEACCAPARLQNFGDPVPKTIQDYIGVGQTLFWYILVKF